MDNLDDSENNAKISDSAYSNSCSNSQSRRSHSSKSTHSGSRSSGSSGYGGKPGKPSSAFSDNSGPPGEKRSKDKEVKKKKQAQLEKTIESEKEVDERLAELNPATEIIHEETEKVEHTPPPLQTLVEKESDDFESATPEKNSAKEEVDPSKILFASAPVASGTGSTYDGFSCVISMHDGVVMYTTPSLTNTLGFLKDMWIGRSFIDFVHPRDRTTFASHITSGLAVPKYENGTIKEVVKSESAVCTMVCRIRKYRSLSSGFGVKERSVAFMPFLLKFSFKNISDEEGKVVYLVIQATPFFSAFKTPNEKIMNPVPFVIRHSANGNVEYVDPEAVPYLGYLPQDLDGKDALQLYHPDDLAYIRQIYETVVKEGGMPRSKSYRMMTQNWDFIKVETEWSSFTNPWSRKLEFVKGKHHIMEGPTNPDVFETPDAVKAPKVTEEEKKRIIALRESIIRILNEVLTKPAQVAKQQMTKRCQDLAMFMESLLESEQPKVAEELHVEIQDQDNSYYERDSVMLGGISPHHDQNDGNSSTETPLSYTQLNYNETLQRYFHSHQPNNNVCSVGSTDNPESMKAPLGEWLVMSSVAQTSGDSAEMSSCESSGPADATNSALGDRSLRLTEALINKHNADMEKELMRIRRETRSSGKGDRVKASNESKQKKKEHLARCNASYQPTSVADVVDIQPHGVKRASKPAEAEAGAGAHKHHCPAPRHHRRRQTTAAAAAQPTSTITTTLAATAAANWPVNSTNTFFMGVGFPQQMSMSPAGSMPGMVPMYYAPAAQGIPFSNDMSNLYTSNAQYQHPMQCMMYGQAMYGSPFMFSPMNAQMTYPLPLQPTDTHPLRLSNSNYEETKAYAPGVSGSGAREKWNKVHVFPPWEYSMVGPNRPGSNWREKQLKKKASDSNLDQGSSGSYFSSSNTLNRDGGSNDSQGPMQMELCSSGTSSSLNRLRPMSNELASQSCGKKRSEEAVDRTDGESSYCSFYSSFYSSFFKTEHGSAEESDANRTEPRIDRALGTANTCYEPPQVKEIAKRKMDPPWMEQVSVTSELVYKYQIVTKDMDEVLKADKMKISSFEQPTLVNEQLGQLYLDLQLEGVAAKLSLEDGISSSSSSDEESTYEIKKIKRKRQYDKLVMFYEEDAPLPPSPAAAGRASPD